MNKRHPKHCDHMRGFTMIDVLISIIILAFGMLSLARVMGQSSLGEMEAYQRSQAMALAQDMVERMNLNRKNADSYVGTYAALSTGAGIGACAASAAGIVRDTCEWKSLLAGDTTLDGVKVIGAPIGAYGCITSPSANIYIVAIAWQGMVKTTGSDSACGEGMFDQEENRRVFSTVVQIATLGT
jgi:type IV pilus assembly protein PilV